MGLVPYDWLVVRQRGDEVIEEVIEEYDDGEDGCTLEDDVKDDERPARPCRPTLLGVTRSTIEDLNTLRLTSLDLNNLVEVCFIVSLDCNGSPSIASRSGV